jgi:hypothetical protein
MWVGVRGSGSADDRSTLNAFNEGSRPELSKGKGLFDILPLSPEGYNYMSCVLARVFRIRSK